MADSTSAALPAVIDYTARDFTSLRKAMLDHAAQVFPQWTGRNTSDFGVALIEETAYLGDILSYYLDAASREAFLPTATRRESVMDLARMLGYTPDVATAAAGTVVLATEASQATPVTVPAGTKITTAFIEALDRPLVYETTTAVTLAAAGGSASIPVLEGQRAGTTPLLIARGTPQEQEILTEALGTSTGRPEQRLSLAESPALHESIRLYVSTAQDALPWRQVDSLLDWGPADQVYEVHTAADGRTTLVLGDGLAGAVPAAGQALHAAYRTGGGTVGNVSANQLVDIADALPGVYIVTSSAMTGGRDAEALESIRTNASRANRPQDRAVSLRDHADLALAVPGIAKARALSTQTTSVSVRVVGAANATPAAELLDRVERHLQQRTVAGVRVTVAPGDLVRVNMGKETDPIILGLYPNHRAADVARAGRRVLQELLSDARSEFGQTIPISRVYRLLDSLPGVEYVKIPLFARADGVQSGAQDVLCRAWEIPVPGDLYLVTDGGF
ncbi:baseplate J/gp47 family protein [Streptomyces sp. NPDC045456]|uniref:baseplate J/gp47 family protein n=1 Tax=Streptomyces sp. NPDC045456 TaxID=3155254 RepID=UPI00340463DD